MARLNEFGHAQEVDIAMTNRKAVVANIYAADKVMQKAVRKRVKSTGEKTRDLAKQFAKGQGPAELQAYDTGRLHDSISLRLSEDKLVYEVYYDRSYYSRDYKGRGPKPYYPVFVEYGTLWMFDRPILNTAFLETYGEFNENLSKEIRKALKRRARLVELGKVVKA